jgi:hypothetical protein
MFFVIVTARFVRWPAYRAQIKLNSPENATDMRIFTRSLQILFVTATLISTISHSGLAADLHFSSPKYSYSLAFPSGWLQVPNSELTRFKESLPLQAQHLVYEAAFQRGNTGKWFEWPYVIVQVIPSDRTKIRRMPTEVEFQQVVTALSGGRTLSKLKEAIDAVPNPEDKAYVNSLLPTLSKPSVQIDIASRKYWFVVDGNDPIAGPMTVYIAGTFMPDGNLLQVNAYTKASRFQQDLGQFLIITRSLR